MAIPNCLSHESQQRSEPPTPYKPTREPRVPTTLGRANARGLEGIVSLQKRAGNRAVVAFIGNNAVQRHADKSVPTGGDPVVYAGQDDEPPHLDHESRALRHQLVEKFYQVTKARPQPGSTPVDRDWVIERLGNQPKWKEYHAHQSQCDDLAQFLSNTVTQWSGQFWDIYGVANGWDQAIRYLQNVAAPPGPQYAEQILRFDFSPGEAPTSLLPSRKEAATGAYWEFSRKAIFVSKALTDPVEVLGAILFECENAKREKLYKESRTFYDPKIKAIRTKIEDPRQPTPRSGDKSWKEQLSELEVAKGRSVAAIEFEVDKANQFKLRTAHGVETQLELCRALGVPERLLNEQKTYVKGQPLELPPRTQLRGQEARNALWWYWVEPWNDDAKAKEIWEVTNHSEVFGSSTSLYGGT